MPEVLRWLNGWVYSLFGADGLLVFSAHPLLYSLSALALLAAVLVGIAWWVSRRVRAAARSLRLAAALTMSAEGRHCLRLAHRIRRGGARLRQAVRQEIRERGERRSLLRVLDRFTQAELHDVLAHALGLIRRADDRLERRLRELLERQTRDWSAADEEPERDRLQQAIAETRQQLARIAAANTARDRQIEGLAEAAGAVLELEHELGELHQARSRSLPEFRDHLSRVAGQVGDLKSAYRELERPD